MDGRPPQQRLRRCAGRCGRAGRDAVARRARRLVDGHSRETPRRLPTRGRSRSWNPSSTRAASATSAACSIASPLAFDRGRPAAKRCTRIMPISQQQTIAYLARATSQLTSICTTRWPRSSLRNHKRREKARQQRRALRQRADHHMLVRSCARHRRPHPSRRASARRARAVKFPSEPPPVDASPSGKPISRIRDCACRKSSLTAGVRSSGGRFTPPRTSSARPSESAAGVQLPLDARAHPPAA